MAKYFYFYFKLKILIVSLENLILPNQIEEIDVLGKFLHFAKTAICDVMTLNPKF